MEYGKLGNTDIEVSKLCVGCMSFGKAGTMHDWTLDEAESENVIKHALVQKFLNKWTIFLFCSILFSSNQKEH